MLNEERIRVMTRMASYEAGEGKKHIPIRQYYRKDYVGYQMIKTFISSTISFGILFLLWAVYSMKNLTEQLSQINLIRFGVILLVIYIIFVVVYQVLAVFIYSRKYSKAAVSVKKYHADVKRVIKLQEREEKLQSAEEWE